ncbi:ABC transporter permease [uncultured Marinobacter sp.]|uniref:ABC transporter permease n=1 Tax=uncultured Marinobacter sp. TaxID=187379 RepID=UPI000C091C80|nr:ABC transporter permease [Marinobacter sp.]MBI43990.1 ABC transporter permease [Oceanospirillales bacterium]|tara:strand:+ start:2737 stop:3870 length:1134 start_codon:yes stop_codon:yes gene_type:complete
MTTRKRNAIASIWHLGVKELRSLWRDKVLLVFVAVAFSLMVYAAGSAGSLELNNAPIAVVDQDQTVLSGRIINAFQPPWFRKPDLVQFHQMDELLDKGLYTFALVIPDGFERDIREGRVTDLQLNIDATRMTQAFIGASYIKSYVAMEVAEFMESGSSASTLPVNLITRASFNPNLDGTWFGGVMELITQVTLISIILSGAALIREREHGTIEHLMVMPLRPFEIMAAKVWANGLVVMIAATLSVTLVIRYGLQVPIRGSILLFLAGALIHLFSTTAIGILIGTVARTMPQFGLLLILTILPLQLLSGGITPRESMPELVQDLMLAAPTTHFVSMAQAILYRGAGLEVVWPQMLALAAIGTVFFGAALALFRRHLSV